MAENKKNQFDKLTAALGPNRQKTGLMGALNKVVDPQIQPGDEIADANNPRNWLTGKVNTILPNQFQIPAQTIADEKQQLQDMPETMALGAGMGSIAPSAAGKITPQFERMLAELKPRTGLPNAKPQATVEEVLKRMNPAKAEELMITPKTFPEEMSIDLPKLPPQDLMRKPASSSFDDLSEKTIDLSLPQATQPNSLIPTNPRADFRDKIRKFGY